MRLRIACLAAWVVVVAGPGTGRAATATVHVPAVRLPLVKRAPKIDGRVGEKEWAGAARMERFGRGAKLSGGEASFWVACDGKELFVAVVSETPPGGKLLARVEPLPGTSDARTWLDDSVELFLDPLRTIRSDRRRIYQAIINAKGAIGDWAHTPGGGGEAWRGRWRVASRVAGDRWHFEAALPLADMRVTPADLERPFGVRVCRNWQRTAGPKQTDWSPMGGAFVSAETMPVVTWDARAPVVQVLGLAAKDGKTVHTRLAVHNPHRKPLDVVAHLRCNPESSQPTTVEKRLRVPGGRTATCELASRPDAAETLYSLIRVASPDAKTVYYQRDFTWTLGRPDPFFILDKHAAQKVAVAFACYPYHNKAKVRVDVSGLEQRDRVRGVVLSIRRVGAKGKPVCTTAMPALRKHKTRMVWAVPPLGEGRYELVASLAGVKVEPVVRPFVRHEFPWEHTELGRSDVVIPPFEPIRVKGRTVATVLRTHTMGAAGLWDQVTSLGQPLFTQPMRLEVQVGDKAYPAKDGAFRFVEKKDTRVVGESRWSAGPVSGTARSEWDYDGMMKWTVRLDACRNPVDAVRLVVSLNDARAPLFHACTDGVRFNYVGRTPQGQGRVWDGSKAARRGLIGSYVPYVWLGAEQTGFCVFGENDRGWVTDAKVPCHELVRDKGTLELRLNLVARRTRLDRARTIVVGFQATPVKPMPADWRRWASFNYKGYSTPGITKRFSFIGSCWTWGCLTPCLDIYPLGRDLTILHEFALARRTGKMNKAYFEKWMARWPEAAARLFPGDKTKQAAFVKRARVHTGAGFHTMKQKPENVVFYTNARGMRFDYPEGRTFMDEWYREAFTTRTWSYGAGRAYDADPVESFRDFHMWYYKQMIDLGVLDSVYWDDTFLQSNWDTVAGEAYELPDGRIQPSVGLWNMREFIRRTAVLFHESGKPNLNVAHMTNAAIVPVLAFARMHYSWEDRSGVRDFQDRFTRDYIRTESIGLQMGNLPVVMGLVRGGTPAEQAHAQRTGVGVILVHELKLQANWPVYWDNVKRMLEFGYGLPKVRVWRYWEPDHPVRVAGTDAVTLVVSKPGSALVVVCDYGSGGRVTLVPDARALKLRAAIRAKDLETGRALDVSPEGAITFPLDKHDFKLVLVESAAREGAKP